MCSSCKGSLCVFSESDATRVEFYCSICGHVLWRKANDPPELPREYHFWADTGWPLVVFYIGLAAVICTALVCSTIK